MQRAVPAGKSGLGCQGRCPIQCSRAGADTCLGAFPSAESCLIRLATPNFESLHSCSFISMASFGKLTNAFLQASQETTLTLANLNFDFTLIKYDAPVEYQGLGESLSTRRKVTAEDGPLHVTARKLSALFGGAVPHVPHLISAYGSRASEIAKSPTVNPTPQNGPSRAWKGSASGIFADHVGADGTSIWAAATSGTNAVTIHLLSCMLARIWHREEAISIWAELVEERKARLQAGVSGDNHSTGGFANISDLTASRVEISRSQLDEWDASARAWLQTADQAKERQQTQFRLLADNISIPVSTQTNVYDATMEAWTRAMEAIENLIQGTPLSIESGAVLLGLSAWHLYPDILVASSNQYVKQHDPLVSTGGVITMGLRNQTRDGRGVSWSLPLSKAKFYGDPSPVTRHSGVKESQLAFEDLVFVALGSVLRSWGVEDIPLNVSLKVLIKVYESIRQTRSSVKSPKQAPATANPWEVPITEETAADLDESARTNSNQVSLGPCDHGWLSLLADAAKQLGNSRDVTHGKLRRLVSFGQRRCPKFLSNHLDWPNPVFGITNFESILEALPTESHRLNLLRRWAHRVLDPGQLADARIRSYAAATTDHHLVPKYSMVAYQSDLENSHKRQRTDKGPVDATFYPQWCHEENYSDDAFDELAASVDAQIPSTAGEDPTPYEFFCGHPQLAAIYFPQHLTKRPKLEKNQLKVTRLLELMEDGTIYAPAIRYALIKELYKDPIEQDGDGCSYYNSLRALFMVSCIYSTLQGARVDLQMTSRILSDSSWWRSLWLTGGSVTKHSEHLANTFACLAYFETGGLDVHPASIGGQVFAMSHSNSIFVFRSLLSDPVHSGRFWLHQKILGGPYESRSLCLAYASMERIVGNVGKPGLAFLISPPSPRTRQLDYESWHMIDHRPFDGTAEDNFKHTSFHLSFTGYELPLDVGQRGGRDAPAYFLETAISVYDRGEWIADVDILTESRKWIILSDILDPEKKIPACDHSGHLKSEVPESLALVCIDTWTELLDPPLQNAVLRAHANPVGRLAAAALATRQCRRVIVLGNTPVTCWACFSREILPFFREDKSLLGSPVPRPRQKDVDAKEMADRQDGNIPLNDDGEGEMEFKWPPTQHVNASTDDMDIYAFDLAPFSTDGSENEWSEEDQVNSTVGRVVALIY